MLHFHHLGIFVNNIEEGIKKLSQLINIKEIDKVIHDESMKVSIVFITDNSGLRYELVAPLGEDSPVCGVLDSRKNILNHIAYTTTEFDYEDKRLREEGNIRFARPQKAKAFNNSRVVFFLTRLGYIIELIDEGRPR